MRKLTSLLLLFLAVGISAGFAQTRQITGRVVDSDSGSPLAGVYVQVEGTNTGTVTGADGTFALQAAANNSLVFSYLGMVTQTIALEGRTAIDVLMASDATMVEEVIVVGYGIATKTDLTGAVGVLSGEGKLRTSSSARVEDMLNGKVPGVFVASGGSAPNSQGTIVVRGKTSISSSTEPLWVLDGVIIGNNAGDINPSDIESITILKDAASTAIYGSQGSNGVIVMTTKKGRSGNAAVSFNAKVGVSNVDTGNLRMMNGAELYDLWNSFPNKETFSSQPWWNEDLRNRNFNWKDQVFGTGVIQDYTVSVRGGSDKFNLYTSLGYYDESAILTGTDYSRVNGRINSSYRAFDWLNIRPSVAISRSQTYTKGAANANEMYVQFAWDSPYNPDGSIFALASEAQIPWIRSTSVQNYLWDGQWNYNKSFNTDVSANFDFTLTLTDWLSFESVNNYRLGSYNYMNYVDPRSTTGKSYNGSIENQLRSWNRLYFNHLFRFNKTFNDVHRISGIVAYEWSEFNVDAEFEAVGRSVPPNSELIGSSTIPWLVDGGNMGQWAMQSIFGNVDYDYDGRYIFKASVRRDGSSRFGSNKRWGTFFSLSGAWNLHNEEFFAPLSTAFNTARVRFSYGSTGNQPRDLYGSYDLYSIDGSYNTINSALINNTAGNPDMTWETTYTVNFGIDASVWSNRLNISLDLYDKRTSGLLMETTVPSVWGKTTVWRNVGEIDNKGIEFTIDGDAVRTNDWRWNIGFNIGANKNKVVELYGKQEFLTSQDTTTAGVAQKIQKPGYDMDTWYVPEWAGVNPDDGTPQWYTNDENGRQLTSIAAQARQTMMGSYSPKFYGGFNTSLRWKFIDLSAIFSYSYGGKIYFYSRQEYDSDGAYTDRNQMNLHKGWSRWEKPGDVATHPQPKRGGNNQAHFTSSRYLEDGSYLRLKNVTLGVDLPVRIKYVSGIRVYASGENLLTFTNYSGVNPEISAFARASSAANGRGEVSSSVSGTARAEYPGIKRWMFGLNITF